MKRGTASLLLWLVICATTVLLFIPSYFFRGHSVYERDSAPTVSLSKNWEVQYGHDSPTADGWQPFGLSEWRNMENYEGVLWVRRTLPPIPWRDPYLYISSMNRYQVFLDGRQVISFHMDDRPVYNHYYMTRYPLRISPDDAGKTLSMKISWDRMKFFGNSWVLAGNPHQILSQLLRLDSARYLYSVIYLIAFAVGLILFVRRKERLYLWFASLALCAGLGLLLLCLSLQWFLNVRSLYYWKDMLLTIGVYSFTGLLSEALGASRRFPVRIVKNMLLIYSFACLIAGFQSPALYWNMLTLGFPWLAVSAIGVVTYAIIRYPSSQPQNERKWLLRGYNILVVCGLGHILSNFDSASDRLFSSLPYLNNVINNFLANGLFLFMLCMAMILFHRIGRVYQESERNAKELQAKNNELEQFHRNLELLVVTRTEELEEANRSLSITMREKAETLAEVSVLEERNRIAHEMHDVVGHTLTAAIVQLEAGKKLAAKEKSLPIDKLDTVSGLVRKGLDDIRKTVRLLKTDSPKLIMEAALRELIRDTIETMEVAIEADIVIPEDLELDRLTEQVIYRALQEGLTNGIRHAGCSWFRYTLRPVGERLEITLWNDGMPFGNAKPGFGLTTMMERIHLLGGEITIGSAQGEDDQPIGCELVIALPLR
ncbi:hypothetical protein D7Z26_14975 [Cohnella endophytica]|uniref:histidine kinase n=1 Tax=Cohnella endophytica TaxID=2419778 RepID=A0A494XY82_9BACL|nr:histidine kinase [Cohnella endophytica]RKP53039.1 hypothetical protein D7Z26_14975 [Cohnella endophytica]